MSQSIISSKQTIRLLTGVADINLAAVGTEQIFEIDFELGYIPYIKPFLTVSTGNTVALPLDQVALSFGPLLYPAIDYVYCFYYFRDDTLVLSFISLDSLAKSVSVSYLIYGDQSGLA